MLAQSRFLIWEAETEDGDIDGKWRSAYGNDVPMPTGLHALPDALMKGASCGSRARSATTRSPGPWDCPGPPCRRSPGAQSSGAPSSWSTPLRAGATEAAGPPSAWLSTSPLTSSWLSVDDGALSALAALFHNSPLPASYPKAERTARGAAALKSQAVAKR